MGCSLRRGPAHETWEDPRTMLDTVCLTLVGKTSLAEVPGATSVA